MAVVSNPVVVMKRYEMKYIMSPEQTEYFKESVKDYMKIDKFGLTSIASLYYDTPNYRLIRTSVEKPPFKEKIRLRSYGIATDTSPVFLELKRKAYGIVYKRRVQSTIPLVKKFFDGEGDIRAGGQINKQIPTFRDYYQTLVPACMIIYDRIAYFQPNGDLRLTIDHNPRYRYDDLDLRVSMNGNSLLKDGYTILEVKVQQAVPLWLSDILTKGKIYKGSFSKYGEAYRQQLLRTRNL